MKQIFTTILIFLQCTLQAQVTADWFNYPGGVAVDLDNFNNVYTASWDYNPGGDITLTKRNASGVILWNVPYNNTDNTRHEVATWVAVDHAGDILVSGTIRSGYSNPVNAASLLMKYNASGQLQWRVVYESSFDGSSTTKCLVDASNNIYVLGIGTGPNGQVTKVKKFDPAGNTVWNYYDSGNGAPVNFKLTPDNKILIVHRTITGSMNGFSKIDLNGNLVWAKGGIASLGGGDAAGDVFGNTYLINGSNTGSVLSKLNAAGNTIWTSANTISGNKVEVGTDHKPVVGGYPLNSFGVVMMKFDTAGVQLWQNLDADGSALNLLALTPMKIDASNAIYIAGSTMSQMGMCKVSSNGATVWAATTPSGYPVSFEFGSDNNVYVTGGTTARFLQSPVITPCLAPTGLNVTNITATSARLNWTPVSNIVRYIVLYKKTTDTTWKRVNVPKTKSFLNVNNLVCGGLYKWKIKTVCDTVGPDLISPFSAVQNFSTGSCRFSSEETVNSFSFNAFPNPVQSTLTVSFTSESTGELMYEIYDVTGRQVKLPSSFKLEEGLLSFTIDMTEFESGVYILKVTNDGNSRSVPVVKQ